MTSRRVVPGPGTYKAFKEAPIGSAVIGDEPRLPKNKSSSQTVPGPGSYKIKSKLDKIGGVMTQENRFKYKKSGVPGPGTYRMPGMFGYQSSK